MASESETIYDRIANWKMK